MPALKTDDEIIEMIRAGGSPALTAMGYLMEARADYPGDVDDIFNLLADAEPICFTYSLADLAQAYLYHKGLIRKADLSESWQVEQLLKYWEDETETS